VHYELEVGGRTRRIALTRSGDDFAVVIDGANGRPRQVQATRIDAQQWSLVVSDPGKSDTPGRRVSYDVTVVSDPAGSLTVHVGSMPVAVAVNGRRRWGRKEDGAGAGSGPQRLAAPMPGKVVRVLVAKGEAVRARQPLVVVEAMKMENELRAGRDGTVSEIHAREGVSVDAGALLIVSQ
jgi:biotin carboxyl carrier protein